ncbi:hypothetical protein LTS17_010419 [Exophiala oligosperma]
MSALRCSLKGSWSPHRRFRPAIRGSHSSFVSGFGGGTRRRSLVLTNLFENKELAQHDDKNKHALVFGASGITGWAIVNQLLSNSPEAQAFSKVSAVTVRPISAEKALWPDSSKLSIYSGIDLIRLNAEGTKDVLKQKIPDIDTVTHVFFNSYKWVEDPKEESIVNSSMLEKATMAVQALCPDFQFFVLPTGTKAYGIHLFQDFPYGDHLPLSESLPRLPEPHASNLFYYWETDALTRMAKGRKWTWCEVRPDLVVGFVPNNNAQCLSQSLGIYLSLYRFVNGRGSKVPWPGTEKSYNVLSSQTNQDMVAKFSIWASLNPKLCGGGEAFNVIDTNTPSKWSDRWSLICSLFGLEGVGVVEGSFKPSEFMAKHRADWDQVVQDQGLQRGSWDNSLANPFFFDAILSLFDYDHQICADKMYQTGFKTTFDEKTSWALSFERFRQAKILPYFED